MYFFFVFEHTETLLQPNLALYQGQMNKNLFIFKDTLCKYLLFATLGSYLACLESKVDIQGSKKGNFWGIFGGGWTETKNGLCSSSDSLVLRKMCDGVE